MLPAALAFASGCTTEVAPTWQRGAPLRVGVTPNYPPLVFELEGTLTGIEVDLAEQLADSWRVDVEFVPTPFEELIPALLDGRIDVIMSGMSITPERSERVHFTRPYLQVGQMALVRSAERGALSEPSALRAAGVRVGFERGTTGEQFVRDELTRATAVPYGSIDAGLRGLRGREIDCFVHDAPTVWRVVGRSGAEDAELTGLYRPLTEEWLAWAVRESDAATLGTALNGALEHWEESGLLEELLYTWIPVRRVSVAVDPEA